MTKTDRRTIAASVIAYSLCSGTLVLLNKLIMHQAPYPSMTTCLQLTATLMFIFLGKYSGQLNVDAIEWKYVVPYLYYVVAFALGVYCNMKSLTMSNVETIIVFRALSPCLVAILDVLFLNREFPSRRSWCALFLIVCGAYGYASNDEQFQQQGYAAYMWPTCYLLTISFEMAYGKRIIRSVDLKTHSGPVLYTNLFGLVPMTGFVLMTREYQRFLLDRVEDRHPFTVTTIVLLCLSCAAGTGIGYSSWWCRDQVSATSFTVIGVMNKCLTILLNVMVWDQHATTNAIMFLMLCLAGGSLYRQAPLRSTPPPGLNPLRGGRNKIPTSGSKAALSIANQADDVWESELSLDDQSGGQTSADQRIVEGGGMSGGPENRTVSRNNSNASGSTQEQMQSLLPSSSTRNRRNG